MAMGSDLTFSSIVFRATRYFANYIGTDGRFKQSIRTIILTSGVNPDAMSRAWAGMTGPNIDMTFTIVDYPKTDPKDWGLCNAGSTTCAQKNWCTLRGGSVYPRINARTYSKQVDTRWCCPV